jgi:DNA uptake protein ComE-like DNA-binding protein
MKNRFFLKQISSKFVLITLIFGSMFLVDGCKTTSPEIDPVAPPAVSPDATIQWANMTLYILKNSRNNTPNYASRSLGYMGLTMYECVVNGSTQNQSLAGKLNGLTTLPKPDAMLKYNWIVAMNAGQSMMLKRLYEHTMPVNVTKIDSLEKVVLKANIGTDTQDVIDRSVSFGQAIAGAIIDWSKTDGGYQQYDGLFDINYVGPKGQGYWKVPVNGQSFSRYPLYPYWGNNRTFLTKNFQQDIPKILPYSTDPKSAYYAQFLEVYNVSKTLTPTQKEIAVWWSDDPASSYGPPGHSYNIATLTIKAAKADLFKAAETYARVGMAVADAFVNCWRCKYTYFAERPYYYIIFYIDVNWNNFWPEPPFPSFSSGHATNSSAMGTVLANLYGDTFSLTDNTHEGHPKDDLRGIEYKNRSFTSFSQMAQEAADSRLYGGIHTRQDNEQGAADGKKIGENINALAWKK